MKINNQYLEQHCTKIEETQDGTFYKTLIRNQETILLIKKNDDNYIVLLNYSYIVNKIKQDKVAFRNLIRSEYFRNFVNYYYLKRNINYERINDYTTIEDLVNDTDCFININGNKNIKGTYGPTDFIDSILIMIDAKYGDMIHQLMDQIEERSTLTKVNFDQTLQLEINSLKRKNQKLLKKIDKVTTERDLLQEEMEIIENDTFYLQNLKDRIEELEEENKELEDELLNYKNNKVKEIAYNFDKYVKPYNNSIEVMKNELKELYISNETTLETNKNLRQKIDEYEMLVKSLKNQIVLLGYYVNKYELVKKLNKSSMISFVYPNLEEQIKNIKPDYKISSKQPLKHQLMKLLYNDTCKFLNKLVSICDIESTREADI